MVTAQKREQSLFDVPGQVSVVSGEELGAFGVDKVEGLPKLVPGMALFCPRQLA